MRAGLVKATDKGVTSSALKLLRGTLKASTTAYPADYRSHNPEEFAMDAFKNVPWLLWEPTEANKEIVWVLPVCLIITSHAHHQDQLC